VLPPSDTAAGGPHTQRVFPCSDALSVSRVAWRVAGGLLHGPAPARSRRRAELDGTAQAARESRPALSPLLPPPPPSPRPPPPRRLPTLAGLGLVVLGVAWPALAPAGSDAADTRARLAELRAQIGAGAS